jgi:hypothetical protein
MSEKKADDQAQTIDYPEIVRKTKSKKTHLTKMA